MGTKLFYYLFLFIICILLFPLQFIIGVIILFTEGSPIIFAQLRIGKNNHPFRMYKFRTMIIDAEKRQKEYIKLNEAKGPVFKIYNDPRFTPFGKFLSHTGLDELPQLWNVLRGDMSFFGPRPLPVDEAKKLQPWQQERHVIKPGIISPWILQGYHINSFDEWMRIDIEYTKKKSLHTDSALLLQAVKFMITLFISEICIRFTHHNNCSVRLPKTR